MSRTTSGVAVSTIGIDTGKNTLHLIGLDEHCGISHGAGIDLKEVRVVGDEERAIAPGSERQRAIEIATLISEQAPSRSRRPSPTRGKPCSKGQTQPRLNCKRSSAGCRPRKTRRKASAVSSRSGRLNSWGAEACGAGGWTQTSSPDGSLKMKKR